MHELRAPPAGVRTLTIKVRICERSPVVSRSKIVFVLGGVCSSLGKGVTAASLARLLIDRGVTVRNAKIDPYLNVDAGTLSPSEHGEVFVTADAGECDLDFGHYERFTSVDGHAAASITSGQVYTTVLAAERRGDTDGGTVQVVPHIVDEFAARVDALTEGPGHPDVVVVEVGGTVGDMEIDPILEAIRRLRDSRPRTDIAVVLLVLIPEVGPSKEPKTKPAQHSVVRLRQAGLAPDVIVARSTGPLADNAKRKLSRLCGVVESRVISAPDRSSIYELPTHFATERLDTATLEVLDVDAGPLDLADWDRAVAALVSPPGAAIRVGLVGKYSDGHDTYLSVHEALNHAAAAKARACDVVYVDAEVLERDGTAMLDGLALDGIVIPGGFGSRGTEGKVAAAQWARDRNVPFLGLCLGLQVAVIAAIRSSGFVTATSAEWERSGPPVITLLDSQGDVTDIGGTLRLGAQPAVLKPGSVVAGLYDHAPFVFVRHRHRYEVNPAYHQRLAAAGLVASGWSPDRTLVEFIEDPAHRFYVATQAHPEFTSRPGAPEALFGGLVAACVAAAS